MEAKTYRVRSLAEAMRLIAQDLGPEASVLHIRQLQPNLWDWWRGRQWEVVAACDHDVPSRFEQYLREDAYAPLTSTSDTEARAAVNREPTLPQNVPLSAPTPMLFTDFHDPGDLTRGAEIRRTLLQMNIHPEVIQSLLSDLNVDRLGESDDNFEWSDLIARFSRHVSFPGELQLRPSGCTRVALVGPTGVGKTTTVAKLAADFHLRLGLQVGLITVDTFRVGAVDQLQAYARILDLPLQVVHSPDQMQLALQDFSNFDVVLIDTVGRSPRDELRIENMQGILAAAELDCLLLTLSASSEPQTLKTAVTRFSSLAPPSKTSLILTKVDECQTLTHVYPLLKQCGLPWRYWTNGQNVPDDLGVAQADVVSWFLDEIQLAMSTDE